MREVAVGGLDEREMIINYGLLIKVELRQS